MKVIFLDFDGVLTTQRTCVAFDSGWWMTPDPVAIALINNLCKFSGAEIVVSSTWREVYGFATIKLYLQSHGISHEFLHKDWATPSLKGSQRGEEIKLWLDNNPTVSAFLIIDDNDDMLDEQKPYFVKTDPLNGFLWEHYLKALQIFGIRK